MQMARTGAALVLMTLTLACGRNGLGLDEEQAQHGTQVFFGVHMEPEDHGDFPPREGPPRFVTDTDGPCLANRPSSRDV